MPSKGSPASTSSVPEWRKRLKDDLGEDPGRFLDRDLLSRPIAYHRVDDEHGGTRMETRPDTDCSTAATLVSARIRGIDRLDRLSAWRAVERKLDRGPRPKVMALLQEREQVLQEHGERPDRLDEQDRRDLEPTESVVEWPERDEGERSAMFSSERAFGGPGGTSDTDDKGETEYQSDDHSDPRETVATDGGEEPS